MKILKINKELFETIMNDLPSKYEEVKKIYGEDHLGISISNMDNSIKLRIEPESDRKDTELIEEEEVGFNEMFNNFFDEYMCSKCEEENCPEHPNYNPLREGVKSFIKDLKPEISDEHVEERTNVLLKIIESTK